MQPLISIAGRHGRMAAARQCSVKPISPPPPPPPLRRKPAVMPTIRNAVLPRARVCRQRCVYDFVHHRAPMTNRQSIAIDRLIETHHSPSATLTKHNAIKTFVSSISISLCHSIFPEKFTASQTSTIFYVLLSSAGAGETRSHGGADGQKIRLYAADDARYCTHNLLCT